MNGNNKALNFISTYKWHLIIWLIGLIVLGNFVYKKVTSPTYLLNGILLGAEKGEEAASKLAEEFTTKLGYTDTVYEINFDTEYSYLPSNKENAENNFKATEKILGQNEEKLLDFVAGPIDSMLDIAYNSLFAELSTTLTPKQYEALKPYILYLDNSVIEKLEDAYENKEDLSSIELPDPKDSENMKEPVAVLIDISSFPDIAEIYGDSEETIAMGIMTTAPNHDILFKFIDYIMTQNGGQ